MRFLLLLMCFTISLETWADNSLRFDTSGRPIITGSLKIVPDIPLSFRFDSGASQSIVYDKTAITLVLPSTPIQFKQVFTATGYKKYQLYRVDGFETLGLSLDVERTAALPTPRNTQAVGLLGVDIFRGHILFLDPANGRAEILSEEEVDRKPGFMMVQGRPAARGSIAINLLIGGVEIPGLIDTGATSTVMNTPAFRLIERHLPKGVKRLDSDLKVIRGPVTAKSAEEVILSSFQMGDETVADFKLLMADLPIFTTLGARNAPAFIIGMDLLKKRPIAFDFKRYRLYLGQVEALAD